MKGERERWKERNMVTCWLLPLWKIGNKYIYIFFFVLERCIFKNLCSEFLCLLTLFSDSCRIALVVLGIQEVTLGVPWEYPVVSLKMFYFCCISFPSQANISSRSVILRYKVWNPFLWSIKTKMKNKNDLKTLQATNTIEW